MAIGSIERLSVVIPCRNEEAYIGACLDSLMAADPGGAQLTIIVCDGMSDDRTREVVRERAAHRTNILLIDNPQRTTPFALNIGLEAVPFDLGMILGAHAEVDVDYLRVCMDALRTDPTIGCAGGVLTNVYGNAASRCIGMAMAHTFGVGGARFRTGGKAGYVDTVAFGVYRREVFEKVGWFDEELVRNQDDELSYRITKAGYRIKLLPAATAQYHVRASYAKLYKQYRQYGYWKVYVSVKHRAVTTVRQVVPSLWVSYAIVGGIAAMFLPLLRLPYTAGVVMYALASVMAAVHAAQGSKDTIGVLRAFWILHAAYGIGYLDGILHFVILGRRPSRSSSVLTR
ncbi:MAG: glycosyltransferase family 2 protein [Flavobacteriales bacterium]|nr:glycosyltransferase family 2 protein [Flavobacteriales bacterium]